MRRSSISRNVQRFGNKCDVAVTPLQAASSSFAAQHISSRTFFFNSKNGQQPSTSAGAQEGQQQPPGTGMPSMGQMLNTKRVQEFMKAPPEKQLETMKAALEMQKKMSKVPGIGFLANKNAQMMEKLIQMQEGAAKGKPASVEEQRKVEEEVKSFLAQQGGANAHSPPPPPPPRSQNSGSSKGGPTLDELRKVNLGAEIEALFAELKNLRESKNDYRDRFNAREKELEDLQRETQKLRESEENMRKKLQLAEKNVLLLNSENMDLQDKAKQAKELKAAHDKLFQQVTRLQANDTAPILKRVETLESDLQAKAEVIRALNRKLERSRRRDPLLQFSQACSTDLLRLLGNNEHVPCPAVEDRFTTLQDAFDVVKQESWLKTVEQDGNGAKLLVASCAQVLGGLLGSQAFLDAVVTISGDLKVAKELFVGRLGFVWTADSHGEGRTILSLPADAAKPQAGTLGPFGVGVALRLAAASTWWTAVGGAAAVAPFSVTQVQAHVSHDLIENVNRSIITYEACRSGGPGGQAANVSETQLTARLSVDGVFLFQAEAQDSRSAVANKEAARERLVSVRRQNWNDNASKPTADGLRDALVQRHGLAPQRGAAMDGDQVTSVGSPLAALDEQKDLVIRAMSARQVSIADVAIVCAVTTLRP